MGSVPADRFFGAASEVKKTLAARVQANALGTGAARRAQGAVLSDGPGRRSAVQRACRGRADDLDERRRPQGDRPVAAARRRRTKERRGRLPEPVCPQGIAAAFADEGMEEPPAPGASPLDEGLAKLHDEFAPPEGGDE